LADEETQRPKDYVLYIHGVDTREERASPNYAVVAE
jgi:hypothetical protein